MTTGLLLLCLGSSGLELNPSVSQVILSINSSFSITCSGWNDVTWRFKREEKVPEFHVEKPSSSSSVLSLEQVTWRHTGVYVCSENGTDETREVAVFVP
ncbi:platelet-derived growth factor receptor beta-like, partial [Sinocyclocheilus rhinocerous]|uniref:platelet-derived growth factor receptor beta-like n=1 Tax=Sinocyclocheilus rhinocerous TaxID=307959 RepID=UPI0007BACE03